MLTFSCLKKCILIFSYHIRMGFNVFKYSKISQQMKINEMQYLEFYYFKDYMILNIGWLSNI